MIIRTVRIIATIAVVNSLGACALMTGANTYDDFASEAQVGLPGATIAEVDGVDKDQTIVVSETVADQSNRQRISLAKSGSMHDLKTSLPPYESKQYRTRELVSELYIAPYLDQNKILHESRVIHFILAEAKWITK